MKTIYRCNVYGNVPSIKCRNKTNHELCPLNESEKSVEYMDSLDKNFYEWMTLRFIPNSAPQLKTFKRRDGNIMPRIIRSWD